MDTINGDNEKGSWGVAGLPSGAPLVSYEGMFTRYGGYRGNKLPERNKTSTAALQIYIGFSRSRRRKSGTKITWSYRLGGWCSRPTPCSYKKKIAEKPIEKDLDGCNIGRHKLRKITVRLGTLNVQGIRNKIEAIIKGFGRTKKSHHDINCNEE